MKGLVVEAAGKICLREDLPLPEIDAYQVLCRNVGCGICNGTDMQLINGQMSFIQYPFVLGHEAVGQVVAVGEKVRSFQEGDYILRSALPGLPGCHSFWGGFAEYGVADDYAARLADHAGADIETSTRQLVPAGIDPVEATMLITLKEVASALHRLRLQPGQNVVVAGCGPVGIAMAALAKCMGAGKVVLAGHHPARIAAAKRLGADLAFDTREQPLADTVRGYMPEGVDLYIDAVGNPNLLMDGMRLIRQEGHDRPVRSRSAGGRGDRLVAAAAQLHPANGAVAHCCAGERRARRGLRLCDERQAAASRVRDAQDPRGGLRGGLTARPRQRRYSRSR